jgi:hypothetical protein
VADWALSALHVNSDVRLAALAALNSMLSDLIDIREAQPAVAAAMLHADAATRLAAAQVTEARALVGCDIRLAFPALRTATADSDIEVARSVWRSVAHADVRHRTLMRAFRDPAARAVTSQHAELQHHAQKVLTMLAGDD